MNCSNCGRYVIDYFDKDHCQHCAINLAEREITAQEQEVKELKQKLRVAEKDKERIRNLYWALEGTREIKFNTWIQGERRWSRDGGSSSKYVTGIHVLLETEYVEEYLKNFRTDKDRRMLEVYVRDIRPKPTNGKVWLADSIFIPERSIG